jgi:methylenetetrahydrofolate dehydrogenase (NADP+)/methenyltetrahydrofolate cyclohydrolase
MAAQTLDGRALARELHHTLRVGAQQFSMAHHRAAHLALLVAGDEHSALLFGQQVARVCHEVGVACSFTNYAADVSEAAIRAQVAHLSNDPTTDGVVVLLPLPAGMRQRAITEVLAPAKDVDGLGPRNAGNLLLGFPSFVPGTAEAVMVLLQHVGIALRGKHAVIVGRSNVGGKPVALQLLRHDATVTVCHSHTADLAAITRTADILVVSVGRPEAITGDMVRPGAIVLDAGINPTPQGIVGDVHAASVRDVAAWLTPVPGGLGPLTHLMVIRHTVLGPLS